MITTVKMDKHGFGPIFTYSEFFYEHPVVLSLTYKFHTPSPGGKFRGVRGQGVLE